MLTESGKFTPKLPYNLWFASGRAFAFRGCYAPGEQTAEEADASTSSAVYETAGAHLEMESFGGICSILGSRDVIRIIPMRPASPHGLTPDFFDRGSRFSFASRHFLIATKFILFGKNGDKLGCPD